MSFVKEDAATTLTEPVATNSNQAVPNDFDQKGATPKSKSKKRRSKRPKTSTQ
jgi:hypothetical protein